MTETITISPNKEQNIYVAHFSTFGETLPTPFFLSTPVSLVMDKIRERNPECEVEFIEEEVEG